MARRTNPNKRELILNSAIHVFSEKTYEKTRVSDIARHAGIAYGLVYHYFENKEEILKCIFQEKWAIFVKVLRQFDDEEEGIEQKLFAVANFLIQGNRVMPELMRLIMLEINRRVQFLEADHVANFQEVFEVLRGMLQKSKERGEIRADVDTTLSAYMFFGSLEAVVLGYAFGLLDSGDDEESFKKASREITRTFLRGMRA